ncbi:dTDP-4-dehydro-6-deoxy-alpha-D-gulose 4-ketoreductase [Amycolatopsis cihanbeyliensis]|uniref:dTDP-4-dehydro-6-deoxy-alpha-D-gulose 4-ketoreductase n=1 Tax=Amycolatopsis cihanbeyliensis TaxID=1128664 RepID=A0A542DJT0_AMYCI|nr:dTDP-4-dehydro-6-deoxy-alpha-D-gulose 4-ketoreductase [Amycolatopsis cihanbeyliensis]WCB87244.1 EfrOIV [Amycolatopsis cihanbeyliensis]
MNADYWHGRTVLVTGGKGFIGAHFAEELTAAGARVISLHRDASGQGNVTEVNDLGIQEIEVDLLSTLDVNALFRYAAAKVDTLIHCAAIDGNSEFKRNNFGSILDSNIRITSNVLNGARDHHIPNVVMLSSTEVYASDQVDLIAEEDDYRSKMELSGDGYRLSKVFAELLADAYRKQFDMRILLARPTNVYGPGDGTNPRSQRVIPTMMSRISSGQPINIWGDGRQRRSFIYVKDLVHAVLQLSAKGSYDTFNISTPRLVSLLELAKLLYREFDVAERIELEPDKPGGAAVRELDTTKMFDVIDFAPRELEDGLAETVAWYRRTQSGDPSGGTLPPDPTRQ